MGFKHTKKREMRKSCVQCGTDFTTGANRKTHCSPACRMRYIAAPFNGLVGCWEWPLSRNPVTGYGQLSSFEAGVRRQHSAHVLSYETFVGAVGSLHVCHKCDNRACFNPAHLFAGTHAENMQDMIAKGRGYKGARPRGDQHFLRIRGTSCLPRGEQVRHAKLTETAVLAIRASDETMEALAAKFGVSAATVCSAKLRKTWKHVP